MSKPTDNRVKHETWMVRNNGKRNVPVSSLHGERRPVQKVAVRNKAGQFHGATNFIGSVTAR